uniref:Protein kinase domain-containing protein n=1 Tax=Tetradesmus obliquus TaxID=3088 RepID=A0A383WD15_TETOB|eukprot:jgi/Sobl393_1/11079/SZX74586.1
MQRRSLSCKLPRISRSLLTVQDSARTVGKGGCGSVLEGEYDGRPVAVKICKESPYIELLRYEGEALYSLQHPCLLRPIALVDERGFCALVMPLYKHGSVMDALYERNRNPASKLTQAQRVRMALKAAQGLACMHRHNWVHLDIKSQNLLCDLTNPDDPAVAVADLGLAQHTAGPFSIGLGCGTGPWMGPEHYRPNVQLTNKVDIYAFGVVLWELAQHCGSLPSGNYTKSQWKHGVHTVRGRRPSCQGILQYWPNDYVALMRACWRTKPEDRPCAECVVRQLAAILEKMER